MISTDELKELGKNLMFEMKEEEYVTLMHEFETFLHWMDKIGEIDGIETIEPMYFPYKKNDVELRSDTSVNSLTKEEIFINAPKVQDDKVSVPRVVA